MKKERKDDSFIKQPYFKGGETALREFLRQNLTYPESSRENNIEGDVHIRYDIDYKGRVIDARIISGLDKACNEEALRVVRMLTFIVPKNPRGLKVTFHKTIRIHFQRPAQPLPKPGTPQHTSVQYNIIPSAKTSTEEPRKTGTTYSFTIQIQKP